VNTEGENYLFFDGIKEIGETTLAVDAIVDQDDYIYEYLANNSDWLASPIYVEVKIL